jgi:VanZ family protein
MRAAAEEPRLERARFVVAIAASFLLVVSSPFMGEARHWLRETFPAHFVTIVGGAVALAALIAVAIAFGRIRDHRPARYGLVVAAVVLAVAYSVRSSIGNPESDVVEHVHFIEYGIVTWLFYRAWRPLGDLGVLMLPFLAGLTVGTCEEWFQWFLPARVGELRDIFLNAAAIVSGLLMSVAIGPPSSLVLAMGRRSRAHVFGTSAVLTALLAAFLNSVHVGYEIADAEAGTFRSIFTTSELDALARDRAARWASDPPIARPARLSREDQYMSEGLLHVQERNRRWDGGQPAAAWFENRILEKYFAPVLNTPSYVSRTGLRWPPEQRADAERRSSADPAGFRSSAQGEFPIFTWSRRVFLAVSLTIVGLLATACAACARRRAPPL